MLVLLEPFDLTFPQFLVILLVFAVLTSHDVLLALWLAVSLDFGHDLAESRLVFVFELVGDLLQGKLGRIIHGHMLLKFIIVDIIVSFLLLELALSFFDIF